MIVELDLESNKIDDNSQLEDSIVKKKEILVFNLKQNPITFAPKTIEDLIGHSKEAILQMSHY
jgi:hypothetical protein